MRRFSFGALSAGLFWLLVCSSALAQEVTISDSARAHFNAGVNYLQDPEGARYEEAYREFKAAYSDSPSWKILSNLGLTSMKLERDGEAIDAYSRYLSEGGANIDAEERAQVDRDLQTLKAGVVQITVNSVPPGVTLVDSRAPVRGEPVVNRYGPVSASTTIGIRAGHHAITAQLAGHDDATWEFDAKPGETLTHGFELQQKGAGAGVVAGGTGPTPAPGMGTSTDTTRPTPTGVYIGLAATGVFAVGAGVTGVLALGKKSDFDSKNDGSDPAGAQSLRDSGQTLNLITDVLMGATVASAAITAILYFNRPEKPASQDSARLAFTPAVGSHGAGLVMSGGF